MNSRAFDISDIRLVYMSGIGTGYFKCMLRLDIAQGVWSRWKNEFSAVGILFEKASADIGPIIKQLWREIVLTEEQKSSDVKRVERYGDLLGTDFNLSFELNAEVWKKIPIPTVDKLFDIFDGLHQAVYYCVYGRKWTP